MGGEVGCLNGVVGILRVQDVRAMQAIHKGDWLKLARARKE
jgi:hypothetical protein